MIVPKRLLSRLGAGTAGSVVIETALVAPVLLLLALGGYDVGTMVARQTQLRNAAAEAEAIVQAAVPADSAARDEIRDALKASVDPDDTNPNDTESVTEIYRCSTNAEFATVDNCGEDVAVSTFIKITLTDTYTPQWTAFGVGAPVNLSVVRMVQIS